jgi:hypothetical protein
MWVIRQSEVIGKYDPSTANRISLACLPVIMFVLKNRITVVREVHSFHSSSLQLILVSLKQGNRADGVAVLVTSNAPGRQSMTYCAINYTSHVLAHQA